MLFPISCFHLVNEFKFPLWIFIAKKIIYSTLSNIMSLKYAKVYISLLTEGHFGATKFWQQIIKITHSCTIFLHGQKNISVSLGRSQEAKLLDHKK